MASEGSSDGPPTSFAQSLRARKGFEAIAIVRYQRARFTPNPSSRSKLTYEDCKELMRLKYSIHQCLQSSSRFQDYGAFVRLSSRSPKDGIPLTGDLKSRYEKRLEALVASAGEKSKFGWGKRDDPNTMTAAFFYAKAGCLRVNSADEAMNLLLTSARVLSDIITALESYGISTKSSKAKESKITPVAAINRRRIEWKVNVLVREWDPRIKPSLEFRAFIHNLELTALTQYNVYTYYPRLREKSGIITSAIVKKWKQIRPLLENSGYSNAVIDFGVIFDSNVEEMSLESSTASASKSTNAKAICRVIELNPFATSTGAGLFTWNKDRDIIEGRDLSQSSVEMIAFRVVERPIDRAESYFHQRLEPLLEGESSIAESDPYFKLINQVMTAWQRKQLCSNEKCGICGLL
ncbi:hypothetical protein AAMO2058_000551000 [Amorphochlora amoebiformis]